MRRLFPIGFAALASVLVLSSSVFLSAPRGNGELELSNRTASLQMILESKELVEDRMFVTLQIINNSTKSIVAYTILKQDETMLTTDGATTAWSLPVGESDTVRLFLPSNDKTVTLLAALFEDGSGEGDFKKVRELKDYRVAVKSQFERAIPVLRQLDSDLQSPAEIQRLRNEIMNLPEKHEDGSPSVAKSEGAKHAKQFILDQLKSNENVPDQVQEYRSKVKKTLERLEKAASKL